MEDKKMRIKYTFFILAAALAACTTETLPEPAVQTASGTYTLVVNATKGNYDTTKALSLDGNTLNATWAAGEEVDVYTVTDGASLTDPAVYTKVGTLTASADGVTTTLSGTVTFSGHPRLELWYGSPSWSYEGQKGTLEDISDRFDYAMAALAPSKYSISGDVITPTASPISFTNLQAIVKFTLKDADGKPITASSLTLKRAGTRYFQLNHDASISSISSDESFTVTRDVAASEFFVAFRPIYNFDIRLETSSGGLSWFYEQTDVKFDAGKYYEVAVKMNRQATTVDLSTLARDITLIDGDVLTGTLDGTTQKIKVSIEDGATVILSGAAINGVHYGGSQDTECLWAGLTCLGDATIVLADGTTNTVTNFNRNYPCIQAAEGKTLVIKGGAAGTGKLIANNESFGAGIGGGEDINCGNIEILGGDITATGHQGAGIGSGPYAACGSITISGGTVTATGEYYSAGIGCGLGGLDDDTHSSCGDITITSGTITATGRDNGAGIGCGGLSSSCGNITITGGNVRAQGFGNCTGIGCGESFDYFKNICGDISISSGIVRVVAIRGDDAMRPIGLSGVSEHCLCGQIYFDGEGIYRDDYYDPDDRVFGNLQFTKTTQRLGDKDQQEGDEHIYDNNTWTLTPKQED